MIREFAQRLRVGQVLTLRRAQSWVYKVPFLSSFLQSSGVHTRVLCTVHRARMKVPG